MSTERESDEAFKRFMALWNRAARRDKDMGAPTLHEVWAHAWREATQVERAKHEQRPEGTGQ